MRKTSQLLRVAAALVAGLFMVAAVAGPASARHASIPKPFSVENPGNNACTLFWAVGQAEWNPWHEGIDTPEVNVTGKAGIEQVGDICLDVVLLPQQVEFTAYVGKTVVDSHEVRIDEDRLGYDFTLVSELGWGGGGGFVPLEIDYVTVQICYLGANSPSWNRCGEEQVVYRDR